MHTFLLTWPNKVQQKVTTCLNAIYVNPQNENYSVTVVAKKDDTQAKSLWDEYDDDGNYIGDNPKYMNDIEEESDTEDGDEEEK